MQVLSIGKLAAEARVSPDTIRFYERRGLLSPAARSKSGYRRYTVLQLHELLVIRDARQIGLTLEQIAELLALRPGEDIPNITRVVQDKLDFVSNKIKELQRWHDALAHLLAAPLNHCSSVSAVIAECLTRTDAHVPQLDESDPGSTLPR